ASPGALAMRNGRPFRIPTLVPTRRRDGACIFLTAADQCAIPEVSPFGFAFFDSHLADAEADHTSKRGHHALLQPWSTRSPYVRRWITRFQSLIPAPAKALPSDSWPSCSAVHPR